MYLILKVRVDVLVHGHVFDLNGSISMCSCALEGFWIVLKWFWMVVDDYSVWFLLLPFSSPSSSLVLFLLFFFLLLLLLILILIPNAPPHHPHPHPPAHLPKTGGYLDSLKNGWTKLHVWFPNANYSHFFNLDKCDRTQFCRIFRTPEQNLKVLAKDNLFLSIKKQYHPVVFMQCPKTYRFWISSHSLGLFTSNGEHTSRFQRSLVNTFERWLGIYGRVFIL